MDLFANLTRATFDGAGGVPCPVAWTDQAVPEDLYRRLLDTYPDTPTDTAGLDPGITRVSVIGRHAKKTRQPKSWATFWQHMADEFMSQALVYFAEDIALLYPNLDLRLEVDGGYAWRHARLLDPGLPPHCDGPSTLIVGLWYFPVPGDESAGGAIRFLRPATDAERPGRLDEAFRVSYRPNRFVVFVNGPAAVHEVTPRNAGPDGPPRRNVALGVKVSGKQADLFLTASVKTRGCLVNPGVGLDLYGDPDPKTEPDQFWAAVSQGREYAAAVRARRKK